MRPNVNSPGYVLAFAAGVSLAFTAAIMALHALTAPAARRSARLFEQKAMVELFGLDAAGTLTDGQVLEAYQRHIRPVTARLADPQSGAVFNDPNGGPAAPRTFLAVATDPATGREGILGYALPVWGIGFWARIDGYLAVTPDLKEVIGITFLRHSETPGLGGRITERAWRSRFAGLDILPRADGGPVLYIGGERPSGPDSPRYRRHVDAITGATGTSTAVARFLNERIAQFQRAARAGGLTARKNAQQGHRALIAPFLRCDQYALAHDARWEKEDGMKEESKQRIPLSFSVPAEHFSALLAAPGGARCDLRGQRVRRP